MKDLNNRLKPIEEGNTKIFEQRGKETKPPESSANEAVENRTLLDLLSERKLLLLGFATASSLSGGGALIFLVISLLGASSEIILRFAGFAGLSFVVCLSFGFAFIYEYFKPLFEE